MQNPCAEGDGLQRGHPCGYRGTPYILAPTHPATSPRLSTAHVSCVCLGRPTEGPAAGGGLWCLCCHCPGSRTARTKVVLPVQISAFLVSGSTFGQPLQGDDESTPTRTAERALFVVLLK